MNSKKTASHIVQLSIASSIVMVSALFVFLILPHFVQATTSTMSSAVDAAVQRHNGVVGITRMTETVKPAERDSERWGGALCNDGTPFAFTIERQRGVSKNNWVIYLEGGDFCDDNVNNCSAREEYYTTTLSYPDGFTGMYRSATQGIFNNNPAVNPDFATANKVYAHYCSSDLWSGTKDIPHATSAGEEWYFAGKPNVKAMFEILKDQYELDDTKAKVLFAGSSAGCFGVNFNAAEVAEILPQSAADDRLKLVSDACFFPNFDDSDHRLTNTDETIGSALIQARTFWPASTNVQCENDAEARGEDAGICFLQENIYPYITSCATGLCLDNLVQMSSIDSVGIAYHHISTSDSETIKDWRQATLDAFAVQPIDWLFSGGGSSYHKLLNSDRMWTFGPSRASTFGSLLRSFWKDQTPQQIVFGNPS